MLFAAKLWNYLSLGVVSDSIRIHLQFVTLNLFQHPGQKRNSLLEVTARSARNTSEHSA